MRGTITTLDTSDNFFVLGETLRPLLTNAMGSSLEIFDTSDRRARRPLRRGDTPLAWLPRLGRYRSPCPLPDECED